MRRAQIDVERQTAAGVIRCCVTCSVWYPATEEHFHQRPPDTRQNRRLGWATSCKTCARARSVRKYYRKKSERAPRQVNRELTDAERQRIPYCALAEAWRGVVPLEAPSQRQEWMWRVR